jgi:hypothetical protein
MWRRIFNGYNTDSATATNFTTPNNSAHLPVAAIDAMPTTTTHWSKPSTRSCCMAP